MFGVLSHSGSLKTASKCPPKADQASRKVLLGCTFTDRRCSRNLSIRALKYTTAGVYKPQRTREARQWPTLLPVQARTEWQGSRSLTTLTRPAASRKVDDDRSAEAEANRKFRFQVAKPVNREQWQIQKEALKAKFGEEGWSPRKRLSPDALDGIRALHNQNPDQFSTEVLAEKFEVSPEVIRRILKSKWRPSESETEDRRRRWEKRGENIWSRMVELGMKPPKKWREKGIRKMANVRLRYNDEASTPNPSEDTNSPNASDLPDRLLSNRIL